MNISLTAFGVILTAVFGGGALSVAVLNAFIGTGGRRADVAAKLIDTSEKLLDRADKDIADAKQTAADAKAACAACEKRRRADAERFESEMNQMRGLVETILDVAHQLLAAARSGPLDAELLNDVDATTEAAQRELWRLR